MADPKLSRRAALAGAVALVPAAGGATAPLPTPDADLLDACAEFDGLEAQIAATYTGGSNHIVDDDERDAVIDPITERQGPIIDRICTLRATTPAGHTARVRTLASWSGNDMMKSAEEGYWNERILTALLRDLLAGGAA